MNKFDFVIDYINKNDLINKDIFYKNIINLLNNNSIEKNETCYLVTHLGLGDNITMSSVARYLTLFYNKVFVLVKDNKNYDNMKLFYQDNDIVLVKMPNDPSIEKRKNNILEKINNLSNDIDIFISGLYHLSYLKSRITNKYLINNKVRNPLNIFIYEFIVDFYNHINIDFKIYSTFFYIPEIEESIQLFNNITKKIIFVHTKSSTGEININLNDYIDNDEFFIVCPNKNYYKCDHKNYELANNYIDLLLIYYYTIIKNANIINIINSSFSCIILGLREKNELLATIINIIDR